MAIWGSSSLGGVYERLLDFTLPEDLAGATARESGRRKATGSFYTPRPLTEALVRRTLAPLVRDASPEAILSLRIVDPAMGSGAFLVAACRYLASAYEAALIRDGTAAAGRPVGRRTAPASGARRAAMPVRSRPATRWPCSWAGCRSGSRHWPRIGR